MRHGCSIFNKSLAELSFPKCESLFLVLGFEIHVLEFVLHLYVKSFRITYHARSAQSLYALTLVWTNGYTYVSQMSFPWCHNIHWQIDWSTNRWHPTIHHLFSASQSIIYIVLFIDIFLILYCYGTLPMGIPHLMNSMKLGILLHSYWIYISLNLLCIYI